MNIDSTVTLNNGIEIPYFGFGTFKLSPGEETNSSVLSALSNNYRHIDSAQHYANEKSIGEAIRESKIPREEIFVTTKIAISNFGHKNTLKSIDDSLEKFGYDYFDLILLHFPVAKLRNESYNTLVEAMKRGKTRAVGVSNFTIDHLKELLENTDTTPTVNQVEFSPYLYQKELHEYCKDNNIQLQSYSPLTQGKKLDEKVLVEIAKKYNKSTAQILIRWTLQHEIIVIPKSKNPERIKENAQVFDFDISDEDMKTLDGLNEDFRMAWDPTNDKQVWLFSRDVIRKLSSLMIKDN